MSTATSPNNAAPAAKATEAPAPSLLDQVMEATSERLDSKVREVSKQLSVTEGHFRRAMIMAKGVHIFREMLTDGIMAEIMSLMNNPLGFQTDRGPGKPNKTPYDVDLVRDVMVSAFLQGAFPVGNEIAILFGQCFLQKAYWSRMVREIPGISDLRVVVGTPIVREGKATVRVACSWKLAGIPNELRDQEGKPGIVFSTILNSQGPVDNACQGKAERQALKRVCELIRGSVQTADPEEEEPLAEGEIPNEVAPRQTETPPAPENKQSPSIDPAQPEKDRQRAIRLAQDFEANLVKADLCFVGQLTAWLQDQHPHKLPIADWGNKALSKIENACKAYEVICRERAGGSELHEMKQLMQATGYTWERLCDAMDFRPDLTPETLPAPQRTLALKVLREEAKATASR